MSNQALLTQPTQMSNLHLFEHARFAHAEAFLEREAPRDAAEACTVACRWNINAIGNRPQDHIGRAILLGNLLGDYRLPQLRRALHDPPDWTDSPTADLDGTARLWARRLLVFHSHWQLFLGDLAQAIPYWPDGAELALRDLMRCRPVGAHYTPMSGSGMSHDFSCQRPNVCPYCHTRRVVELIGQLQTGPWADAQRRGRQLFMVQASIPAQHLDVDPVTQREEEFELSEEMGYTRGDGPAADSYDKDLPPAARRQAAFAAT